MLAAVLATIALGLLGAAATHTEIRYLAIVVAVSLLLCVTSSTVALVGALVGLVLLPVYLLPYFDGSNRGPAPVLFHSHPVTVLSLIAIALHRREATEVITEIWNELPRIEKVGLSAIGIAIGGMAARTLPTEPLGALDHLTDIYLGPVAFAILVLMGLRRFGPDRLALVVTLALAIPATIAPVELALHTQWPYGSLYSGSVAAQWYQELSRGINFRATSTLGHPLTGASVYLLGLMLSTNFVANRARPPIARLAFLLLSGLFVLALVAAWSRAALVAAFVGLLLVSLEIRPKQAALVLTVLVAAVISAVTIVPLREAILERILSPAALVSLSVRLSSALMFLPLVSAHPLGVGHFGASLQYSQGYMAFAPTSSFSVGFENPWLMLALDVGLLPVLVYALGLATFVLGRFARDIRRPEFDVRAAATLAVIVLLLMFSTFNSFATKNTTNYWLYLAVALSLGRLSGDKVAFR